MGSPNGKGCFIGMTLATTPGRMLRAVMEGQVFDNRRILEIFTEQGYEIESIYAICGGAKSTVWNQIRADIYNKAKQYEEEFQNFVELHDDMQKPFGQIY